jgi:potassium efflux system protein
MDLAWVNAQLEQVREDAGSDESTRGTLETLYQECRASLTAAATSAKDRDRFAALREEIPDKLSQLKAEAEAEQEPTPERSADEEGDLQRLEEDLTELESELSTGQSRLRALKATPQERTDRLIEIARLLAEGRGQLEELEKPLKIESKAPPSPEVTTALEAARTLKIQALEVSMQALKEEQLYYEGGGELLSAEIEHAAREVERVEARVDLWRQKVTESREGAIEQDMSRWSTEAERALQLSQNNPVVSALIQTNQTLVARRADPGGLVGRNDEAGVQLAAAKEQLRLLQDGRQRVEGRLAMIESAGVRVDEAIGHLLRQEKRRLPAYEVSAAQMHEFHREISSTLASLVKLQDQRADLHLVERRAVDLATGAASQQPAARLADLRSAIAELLRAQRDYLDRLIDDHNRYLHRLLEWEVTSHKINAEREAFGEFISERVLWIRSAPRVTLAILQRNSQQFRAYLASPGWPETMEWLGTDMLQSPRAYWTALLIAVGLIASRRWLRHKSEAITSTMRRQRDAPLRLSIAALLLAALQVLPWVWPTLVLGWRLSLTTGDSNTLFVSGFGQALTYASWGLLISWTLRELCRPQGVAEIHFQWPSHNTRVLFTHLSWAVPVNLPLVFLVILADQQGADAILGQGLFLSQMLVVAVFAHCVLRPKRGLRWQEQDADPGRPSSWHSRVFYALGLMLPVLLFTAAFFGYYYSALKLNFHLRLTVWIILACILLRAVILRWLLIVQLGAQKKAQQLKAESSSAATNSSHRDQASKPVWFNLADVVEQSRSLIRAGLWILFLAASFFVWSDAFPALKVLDDIPVPGLGFRAAIAQSGDATSTTPSASGLNALTSTTETSGSGTPTEVVQVTGTVRGTSLADLLIAAVILLVGIVVMGNLPGLLQLLLLKRLDLRPGVGYAVATLVRYGVVLIAVLMACAQLGITWSKVQWIAAAFSLGIAFGLQEMFANFFSGLIILFERPIRIGDIVTVGDVSGNVTRINIRATTITDWDRREFLVPNKDFITGKLLNWTLSDPVTRVLVEVGIAYGSDTDLAEKLLLEAAEENTYVMHDPAPRAIFWGFGDNALQFRLYVHIPKRNFYFELLHGLTTTINRKFNEAGITIAFPQRDVHLNATHPIEVRVLPGDVRQQSRDHASEPPTD